jgi:hypothetical protein
MWLTEKELKPQVRRVMNDRHEAVVLLAEAWDKKEELINQWYEDMKRK